LKSDKRLFSSTDVCERISFGYNAAPSSILGAIMIWTLLTLFACKPATPAPDTIEDMVVWAFASYDDPEALAEVAQPIHDWADAHEEAAREGWSVSDLTVDDLAMADVPDADIEGVIGALGLADYASDLDDVVGVITHPDRTQVYDHSEEFSIDHQVGDRACFLSRECDRYEFTSTETTKVALLGRSTRTVRSELLWLSAESEFMIMRQTAPDPVEFHADIPLMGIDQQYGLALLRALPGGGVRRVEAFWVEARLLGSDLPEGLAVRTTVNQFQKAADDIDAWLSGED